MFKEVYLLTEFGERVLAANLEKSRGGRGHKSSNKYERFTASVPPDVLALLDEYATAKNINRSEALTQMLERHMKMWPLRKK